MSGLEAGFVVGLIASVISIIEATKAVYDAAGDAKGQPKAFRQVAARLPVISEVLHSAIGRSRALDETAQESLELILKSCKEKAEALNEIFQKVIRKDDDKWYDRYKKALSTTWKADKVECLMEGILKDIHVLVCERIAGTATAIQIKELDEAIKEMNEMPSSFPDEASGGLFQSHTGSGDNIGHTGLGTMNIHKGPGDIYHNVFSGGATFGGNSTNPTFNISYNQRSLISLCSDNEELLDRLFCVDYKAAQNRPRQPQRGTCQWIFGDRIYGSWLNCGTPSMLMLTGHAGTGKTVLTRCVAEKIISASHTGEQSNVAYLGVTFFCSYHEAAFNSEKTVLRSLLHQLIQLDPRCADIVRNRLQTRTNSGLAISLEISRLWAAFLEVLSMHTMKQVFVAIDAIEELDVEVALSLLSGLWQVVQDLSLKCPESRLRVFVSSRHNPVYTSALPNLMILPMKKSQIQRDINAYLQAAVKDFARKNRGFGALVSSSTRLNIVTQIGRIADGMFLVAVLSWEGFCKGILWNQDIMDQKLQELPSLKPGMTAFYDRMVNGIDESIKSDTFSIFAILAAAAMPLSETELGIILGIYSSSKTVVQSTDFRPCLCLNEVMETNLPGLVTVQDDDRVTFVHLSFKEYLQNKEDFQEILRLGRHNITWSCLKYLKLSDLLRDACDGRSRAELVSRYPFLSYTTTYFLHHMRSIPHDDSLWLLLAETAAKDSVYTLESLWPEHTSRPASPLMEVLDRVPFPAKEVLIRKFKDYGYDLDEQWSRHTCGRPLQHCCSFASSKPEAKRAAYLLLELGANPSLPKKPWRSNLKRTLAANTQDLYNALLHHPLMNLSDQDEQQQTLLHILIPSASMERISEVIDVIHDVDVNLQDINGYTPLHLATSAGRPEVVRKLLTVPGIRLDLADNQGRTAFTLATYWGMKSVALVLIEHSQAFSVPKDNHVSGLVFAAMHQDKSLCIRLLEISSYKNLHLHMDVSGKCILHHAALNNWSDVLKSCMRLGGSTINLNQIDHSGRSALHYAAAVGNVESCGVLVSGGASLTLQDRNGRTAAHAAIDAGFKDALMTLLQSGRVDPNQRDLEGRNLIHWAATLDCVDVIEKIRDTPGELDLVRRDKYGKRPIDIAFQCGCKNVGQFLAREMQTTSGLDTYDWDALYRSPDVLPDDEIMHDSCEMRAISDYSGMYAVDRVYHSRLGVLRIQSA